MRVAIVALLLVALASAGTEPAAARAAEPTTPGSAGTLLCLLPCADVGVDSWTESDEVAPGGLITYHIAVTNYGPSDAVAVTLTNAIPDGTTFVSFHDASERRDGTVVSAPAVGGIGTLTATALTLPAPLGADTERAVKRYVLTVRAGDDRGDGSWIDNDSHVRSGTHDPYGGNHHKKKRTCVKASADLSVTKTDAPDPVIAGEPLTYTITVTNAGPSAAQNVVLTDQIPARTTFVAFVQTSGPAFTTSTPPVGGTGTVTATTPTLAAGATATFTLIVATSIDIPGGDFVTNTATVTSSTPDPNTANNSATTQTEVLAQGGGI